MEKFSLGVAKAIAIKAHEGQLDHSGEPYINHPSAVMNFVQDPDAKMVAILHDVVEDSEMSFNDLQNLGCPLIIIEALRLVTHPPDFDHTEDAYMREIQKIADSKNQLAIDVKFADLTHNSDLSRLPHPSERDMQRWRKYQKAKEILRPLISNYLHNI